MRYPQAMVLFFKMSALFAAPVKISRSTSRALLNAPWIALAANNFAEYLANLTLSVPSNFGIFKLLSIAMVKLFGFGPKNFVGVLDQFTLQLYNRVELRERKETRPVNLCT